MRLYRGSDQVVADPVILEPDRRMDFGRGFCTTESYVQAERWAKNIMERRGSEHAYVSEYEYEYSEDTGILAFEALRRIGWILSR